MLNLSFGQTLITHLEFKVSHDGNQVGIAAALTNAIDRSLHLDRAFTHGSQRIDDRTLRVVMSVDSKWMMRGQA